MASSHALQTNRHGRLVTCDTDGEMAARVRQLARSCPLPTPVLHAKSETVINQVRSVDLAFIDSGNDRAAEVTALVPRDDVIALHYTAPHQWEISNEYFESLGLQCLYMNTPRGLTLFQHR